MSISGKYDVQEPMGQNDAATLGRNIWEMGEVTPFLPDMNWGKISISGGEEVSTYNLCDSMCREL